MTATAAQPRSLRVEFCGAWSDLDLERPFVIGREGDLVVDDNAYLHRRFLEIRHHDGLWWLANAGNQLAATVTDEGGRMHAWVAPGAHLPVVFPVTIVRFTAGPTNYELSLHLTEAPFSTPDQEAGPDGTTTLGRVALTTEQHLLVLALAEPALARPGTGAATLPTNAEAARRLGWAITKFNRKLDNVCSKLDRAGVQGMHGGTDRLASMRRARLVEYAIAVRLVTTDGLPLLDQRADAVSRT